MLDDLSEELEKRGLFIVADSAYALSSYIQVPYDVKDIKDSDPEKSKETFIFLAFFL